MFIALRNRNIALKTEIEYLGIILDLHLNLQSQINRTTQNAYHKLKIIWRLALLLSQNDFHMVLQAIVTLVLTNATHYTKTCQHKLFSHCRWSRTWLPTLSQEQLNVST